MIPTHYNARVFANRRAEELTDAFDALAEVDTTDYNVGTLVATMLSQEAE